MKRRNFLKASVAAAGLPFLPFPALAQRVETVPLVDIGPSGSVAEEYDPWYEVAKILWRRDPLVGHFANVDAAGLHLEKGMLRIFPELCEYEFIRANGMMHTEYPNDGLVSSKRWPIHTVSTNHAVSLHNQNLYSTAAKVELACARMGIEALHPNYSKRRAFAYLGKNWVNISQIGGESTFLPYMLIARLD